MFAKFLTMATAASVSVWGTDKGSEYDAFTMSRGPSTIHSHLSSAFDHDGMTDSVLPSGNPSSDTSLAHALPVSDQYKEALSLLSHGKREDAYALFVNEAQEGNKHAAAYVARLALNKGDFDTAFAVYKELFEGGGLDEMAYGAVANDLGLMHGNGQVPGEKANVGKALALFKIAQECGLPAASFNIKRLTENDEHP